MGIRELIDKLRGQDRGVMNVWKNTLMCAANIIFSGS